MAGKRTQPNHHALPKYVYIRRGWYVYREYLGQGKLGKDIKKNKIWALEGYALKERLSPTYTLLSAA